MGAATRDSTEQAVAALAKITRLPQGFGGQLLAVARAISSSHHLGALLTDVGIDSAERAGLVTRVFDTKISAQALELVRGMAASRWSHSDDLIDALEQVAFRALARSTRGPAIETELFAVHQAVSGEQQVELALGNAASPLAARFALVDRLLVNAAPSTLEIVRHVVELPRHRRIVEALRRAERIVAGAKGRLVATVQVARPLGATQIIQLERSLATKYGRTVAVNQVIDAGVIGGVRIAIGDDVIDGTIRSRLDDLRLQLA